MTRAVPNQQIAEEAATWAILIDGGDINSQQREELVEWLRASPLHVEELLLTASLLSGIAYAGANDTLSLDELLAERAPEVVQLFEHRAGRTEEALAGAEATTPHDTPSRWHRPALAASLLAIALVGTMFATGVATGRLDRDDELAPATQLEEAAAQGEVFFTRIGEQRSVVLDDGSIVHLNAHSAIRVALDDKSRNIELVSGEALFKVAHDKARPFRVTAGSTIAQAVGTTFNVERAGNAVQVTVVEGRVLVQNGDNDADRRIVGVSADVERAAVTPIILDAGQLVKVGTTLTIPQVRHANLEAVISWRDRELTFDADTLDAIAAKFNRYNKTQIVLVGGELAQNAFSGVFDADDPDSFIAFLELTGRFSVDRSHPGEVILTNSGN